MAGRRVRREEGLFPARSDEWLDSIFTRPRLAQDASRAGVAISPGFDINLVAAGPFFQQPVLMLQQLAMSVNPEVKIRSQTIQRVLVTAFSQPEARDDPQQQALLEPDHMHAPRSRQMLRCAIQSEVQYRDPHFGVVALVQHDVI